MYRSERIAKYNRLLELYAPGIRLERGIIMEGFANIQRGFSRLSEFHFHRMITAVVQQGDGITSERLTVEG